MITIETLKRKVQNTCNRCGGRLLLDRDDYEEYLYCLQCGNRIYKQEPEEYHEAIGRPRFR